MQTLGNELGAHSAFVEDAETLFLIADSALPNFSGGNGQYRYAKAVELSSRTNAVLTLAPRYENTAMILDINERREIFFMENSFDKSMILWL